ncbi:NAD-glutamate dehydrogenase [Pseudonocardiaceae bacterium YIM PH 21723]|nr:NAD-glutamate dehydrogenase [Pseudonocardiaceae bacterium YIM PH 21723]
MTSTGAFTRSGDAGPYAGSGDPTTPGGAGFDPKHASPELLQAELLANAAELHPDRADLLRRYYRHAPAEEIIDSQATDLSACLTSHMNLAATRVPGRPAIRVFNPSRATDGWDTQSTVIQVVTDDMPYLVDSVIAELNRAGVGVQRIVHPILVVRRDVVTGVLQDVLLDADPTKPPADAIVESWMRLEADLISDPERGREIEQRLHSVLNDVREVVEDTEKMISTALQLAGELEGAQLPLQREQVTGSADLLRWLADEHFTFLGYRRYELVTDEQTGEIALRAALASGLGVLRQDSLAARSFTAGAEDTERALAPNLLVLTEASAPSTVHRSVYPYYVGVKTFGEDGQVTGEHRFLGMLTTAALHEDVLDIPVIAKRVRDVVRRAGLPLESYSGQRMLEVIQNYPRSELFSADEDSLYETATGVLSLAERRTLRLFLRRDPYGRFFSCLVYLPRDRYTTTSRLAMQEVLLGELQGTNLEYSARIGESQLARVHFIVHTDPASSPEPDAIAIQDQLGEAIRTWDDLMSEAVAAEPSQDDIAAAESIAELGSEYANAFPEAYKEDFSATEGLSDLRKLQALDSAGGLDMSFYVPHDAEPGERRFKLYIAGEKITLSKVLPVLQRMGVEVTDERPYEITRDDGVECWIYDFGMRLDQASLDMLAKEDIVRIRDRFQDAFAASWRGLAEVDGFNSLVLRGGLTWQQASLLRAYTKYLRQAGTTYSQDYIEDAILANTSVAVALVQLFETRFDPVVSDAERESRAHTLSTEITAQIDEVTSLDVDRILRSYLTLINATLRTNYFVRDEGVAKPYISFKLNPQAIPDLPEPRPAFEIFVYSPRIEGVHLRFGPVARGGLRWSDRREDFRTEILGLVKAQAVKNAVIVPVGSKGGFVVKRPPVATGDPQLDREAFMAEGIGCYKMFISGLLDLTDNLVHGEVVPAREVVRHDGDDTYLVVAADKGTATFSDIANGVAASYGFWLGDAFASGGSIGYDHKAMGITAKGAWEAVKRHFRELGLDTQSEDFTTVGVGDMSGDVFGNGMLLSEHIRLVAAFDHRHIFIDPDPDATIGYVERQRLFEVPRSSWDDYDRSKISEGGGVWPRSTKSIPITEQVRMALGLPEGTVKLSPQELMKAVLLAPVDLLWNGGIGTYVKASTQTNAEVGDKANDALRVDGSELRVKVIGEGGNLGLTQQGRIEFAKKGGKVNTDALDNSAGVDCSDHEVNIKILLEHQVTTGKLSYEDRNELLVSMTDEVGELVLQDNYRQNAVLGVSRAHNVSMLPVHARLITDLEKRGKLDRHLEVLPGVKQFKAMDQAGNEGLTSPELATVLAHVKLDLKEQVLASDLPDIATFAARLPEYFPTALRERFGQAITQHPLRREITTTLLVNEVVDGAGVSYAYRLREEMTASATDAVRAYAVVTKVYGLREIWDQIDALDNIVPTGVADDLVLETRRLLDRAARWLLTNRPQPLAVGAEISRFRPVVEALAPHARELLRGREREQVAEKADRLIEKGVPVELAQRVASLLYTYAMLDITEVAELAEREAGVGRGERTAQEAAELYYALSDHLDIDRMLDSVSLLERGNRWHALARLALRDDLYSSTRAITLDVLRSSDPGDSADEKIAKWEEHNASRLLRARSALEELRSAAGKLDLATLSVAARQVRSMIR